MLYVSRGRRKVEWNRDCSCERARKERESWEAEVGTGAREDEEDPVHGRLRTNQGLTYEVGAWPATISHGPRAS